MGSSGGWRQIWQDIVRSLGGAPPPGDPESEPDRSFDRSETEPGEVLRSDPEDGPDQPPEPAVPEPVGLAGSSAEESEAASPTPISETLLRKISETPPRQLGLYLAGLLLLAVGAWVVLSGSGLQARLFGPKPPAPDVVATFKGGQITVAEVEAHLQLLVPEEYQELVQGPDTFLFVVEDLVTEELVRIWAAERQPDQEEAFQHSMQHITDEINLESFEIQLHSGSIPVAESEIQDYYAANREQFGELPLTSVREDIRQTLVSEREQEYIEDYIGQLKTNASITRDFDLLDVPIPPEDDLRRYYEDNRDQLRLPRQATVTELEFPIGEDEAVARRAADDALLKLRSAASFEEVAQASLAALLSGEMVVSEGMRDADWEAAVFQLTEGEIGSVLRAGQSFFVVQLNQLQPARIQAYEEVRELVLHEVQAQADETWFEEKSARTLFTLRGRQYSLGEFYQEYRELPVTTQAQFGGTDGMTRLAELLIERLLLVSATYDQLLDVQNQPLVDEARLQVLIQMMDQEEVDDQIDITEEEIQQFYQLNAELMALPPQVRIRYIRIGLGSSQDEVERAQQRADEAYKKLVPGFFQSGAAFEDLALEYSEDPETAVNGGELPGWIGETDDILAEIELHPFHEVVLPMRQGEISRPFEFGGSLYIVEVIERSEAEPLSPDQARPYIEQILTDQEHDQLSAQLQEGLLEQVDLVIYRQVLLDYFEGLEPIAP